MPFERAYTAAMVSLVSRLQAGDAANPLANDPGAIVVGRNAYTGQCSLCHGPSGDGRGGFGVLTYPDAADLTAPKSVAKTDAQLFLLRFAVDERAPVGRSPD